jgi:hypothetical protein
MASAILNLFLRGSHQKEEKLYDNNFPEILSKVIFEILNEFYEHVGRGTASSAAFQRGKPFEPSISEENCEPGVFAECDKNEAKRED